VVHPFGLCGHWIGDRVKGITGGDIRRLCLRCTLLLPAPGRAGRMEKTSGRHCTLFRDRTWVVRIDVPLAWSGVLARFFGDQVVERVNRSILAKLTDVPQVAFVIAICFLPWWGSLADAFRSWRRERGGSMLPRDSACVMLAGWSLIFLLLASCVDRVNVRYQTPIVPFVSALAAGLLASLGRERQRFWFTRLGRIASVALGTVAIGTAAICLATGESARLGVIGGLIGCYVAVGFAVYSSRMNCQQMAFGAVLTLLLIVPLSYVAASGLVTKTLEEKLLARINALHGSDNTIGLLAKPAYASRLRVASGGTLDVR